LLTAFVTQQDCELARKVADVAYGAPPICVREP
jgi:hypothetical protein